MAIPSYGIEAYHLRIWQLKKPCLLVEGVADKRALEDLLEEIALTPDGRKPQAEVDFVVDTANIIESPPGIPLGNREKVIKVSSCVGNSAMAHMFVGFVDREFDGYTITDQLVDNTSDDHCRTGRLVRSRGHSLENYLLDYGILREPLGAVTPKGASAALKAFHGALPSCLHLACAAGLAGRSVGNYDIVRRTLGWQLISYDHGVLSLSVEKWRDRLRTRIGPTVAEALISEFKMWHDRLRSESSDVVRWACHGHIAFALVWQAYARCVLESTGSKHEAQHALGAQEDVRLRLCLSRWIQCIRTGEASYPRVVIEMLGFSIQV